MIFCSSLKQISQFILQPIVLLKANFSFVVEEGETLKFKDGPFMLSKMYGIIYKSIIAGSHSFNNILLAAKPGKKPHNIFNAKILTFLQKSFSRRKKSQSKKKSNTFIAQKT